MGGVYSVQAQINLIIRFDNHLFNEPRLVISKKVDISYLKPCFMQKYVLLVLTLAFYILFIGEFICVLLFFLYHFLILTDFKLVLNCP